jgi:regulator of protease activity HflC (stomatin/prohibitin superfamily)
MNKSLIGLAGAGIAVIMLALYGLAGITGIELGEVGLKIKAVGENRGTVEVLTPGTQWVDAWTNDVVTYDARLRQYVRDDIPAQSQDGQPLAVDISYEIGLVAANVPNLHKQVGPSWYEQLVAPRLSSAEQASTSGIPSAQIYTQKGRDSAQLYLTTRLQRELLPYGIRINANVKDIDFTNPKYLAAIERKAVAEENEVAATREAEVAVQDAIKKANDADGEKQKRIKAAEAQREERRLAGEGSRLAKEEEAKGNLALAKAEAEGIRLRNDALNGSGGDRIVQIEWARNLGPNVKVYAVPTGAPGTASMMDLNGMLKGAFSGAQ